MFVPIGAFGIEKFPSASVEAEATGFPDAGAWHCVHVGPSVIGASGSFGT